MFGSNETQLTSENAFALGMIFKFSRSAPRATSGLNRVIGTYNRPAN
jgi:hypothetical protein